MSNDNEKLCGFLDTLSSSIRDNTLGDDELQKVGEFYMKYVFENEIQGRIGTDPNMDVFLEDDFKKFLVMGYHIYTNLLSKSNE